jgi:phosphomannomutase
MSEAPPIRFGTDGWRALVAEEFTFPNVRIVAQAIALYLKRHPVAGRGPTVLVGFDTRPLGDRFAEAVAEVLAGNGLKVLLTRGPAPTPAVSFAIRHLKTMGGVVVTASHNPFTYNGIKFKPYYAGPAEPKMTQWLERNLSGPVRRVELSEAIREGSIRLIDLAPSYLSFLRRYVSWPILQGASFRVAYDSMEGAGQDLLQRAVKGSRLTILSKKKGPGPVLSRHRPEPVGEHLEELSRLVRSERCHVGLATDGDADRAGVVGPDGRFISSQETMALLTWHLLADRGLKGMVVTTVAGTNVMDAVAGHYHAPFRRTPVGFKHIAHYILTEDVLFGGEESGGFGFKGCVPERDGILAGLLILEMMAMRRQGLDEILRDLRKRFGRWIYRRADLTLSKPVDRARLLEWAKTLTGKRQLAGGLNLAEIDTTDGVKLFLEDRSWLLMRPSGTEPLLRIYAEAKSEATLKALLAFGQQVGKKLAAP